MNKAMNKATTAGNTMIDVAGMETPAKSFLAFTGLKRSASRQAAMPLQAQSPMPSSFLRAACFEV